MVFYKYKAKILYLCNSRKIVRMIFHHRGYSACAVYAWVFVKFGRTLQLINA
jgi:hypothetical protein